MISATVLADSVSPAGIRLTTMQVTMHRFVLAEFNTHRMFRRNFRSSRAVPVERLLREVRYAPALPVVWRKNIPGMQAGEDLDPKDAETCQDLWITAARMAAGQTEALMRFGLHKSWANRLLEPFLYVHGVVTSTDWENFYELRCHKDAQPELRLLAEKMRLAHEVSEPKSLIPGEWHLPYITEEERNLPPEVKDDLIKMSVARCARVSYRLHSGETPDYASDLKLYEKLVGSIPLHASPAEHQATPSGFNIRSGNFIGWRQYRKQLPGEYVLTQGFRPKIGSN